MGYVYGLILVGYLLLFAVSRKEKLPLSHDRKGVMAVFGKMGAYLYRKGEERKEKCCSFAQKQKGGIHKRQLGRKLQLLNPGQSEEEQIRGFYTDRYAIVLLVFFCGTVLCMGIWLSGTGEGLLQESRRLGRNEYGEGDVSVTLKASIEGKEEEETLSYVVEERECSEAETEELYEEAMRRLPDELLGENSAVEDVRYDLSLPLQMEGLPFRISWESSSYQRVNTDGTVHNEELAEPELVTLTAHFAYLEFQREYQFYVQVNPPVYTEEERIRRELEKQVAIENENSRSDKELVLPDTVGERRVEWKEEREDGSRNLLVLTAVAAVIIYLVREQEMEQKLKERSTQMLLDYPEIVNKLTLYMGAGMTVRNAFVKLGEDYRKQEDGRVRYVYEEILMTCHELQSGRSEPEAYDHFGKRCQLQVYIRLSTLLSQNIRKGSNDLFHMLRTEVEEAFGEREKMAKRLGEEAGTKLLVPMMLMLCVVMVIIMIPAYFSFSV